MKQLHGCVNGHFVTASYAARTDLLGTKQLDEQIGSNTAIHFFHFSLPGY
jgi:hypothetical protein